MIKDKKRRLKQKAEKIIIINKSQIPERIAAYLQMMAGQLDDLANKIF